MQAHEPRLQVPDALADLTPSAKLCWSILSADGPMCPRDLTERSQLSPRTVRSALRQLRESDAVEREIAVGRDSRFRQYSVVAPGESTSRTR